MIRASDLESIEKKTGKSWEEWVALLHSFNAAELSHAEIVKKLQIVSDLDGWWRQNITVAFEQHIGRRVPGQREDGTFEVSVTKTLNGTMDEVFSVWLELTDGLLEFNGVRVAGEESKSETPKWRNWRVNLEDGTKVVVGINQKTPEKALLGLAHQKLASADDAEMWRSYWREFLTKFNQLSLL